MKKKREATVIQANPLPYPEIFFRLQPDISLACDEMINAGITEPTKENVEQMSDRIHDSVCRRYPDLADYAYEFERKNPLAAQELTNVYDIRISQRGFFRDLIAFLLIGEFFRRRRFRRFRRFRRRFM